MEKAPWKSQAIKLFLLFGVPLIMLLIGIWQYGRGQEDAAVLEQLTQMEQILESIQAEEAAHPGQRLTYKDDAGRTHDVAALKQRLQSGISELQSGGLQSTTRKLEPILASMTVLCSVLALLWAAVGMVYQRGLGKQALQSREQLLNAFLRGKKLLPSYMVVMVLLLFGAAIPLMLYELMPILRHQRYSSGDIKLMAIIAIFAAVLLYYGFKVMRDVVRAARQPMALEPLHLMGQVVTREQTPKLWALVDKVAERVGAGGPDHIVVGLNEGFFVTEQALRLSNGVAVPHGRVLYLPLPYMAFLNVPEVAAVVGHELGHFVGEDTLYSQRFAPIYSSSIAHISAVAGAGLGDEGWRSLVTRPATIFGEMFLDSFHEAVRFWSRQRELAADAVGAKVAGTKAVATSLLRITALAPHVEEALAAHWDSGTTTAGGVLGHVRQLVASQGMVDPRKDLENRQSHPFDTHPELSARLQALGLTASDDLLARAMDASRSGLLQEFGLEAAQTQGEQAEGEQASASEVVASNAAAPAVLDINAALQNELTQVAAGNRRVRVQVLKEIAAKAGEPKPVKERVGFLLGLAVFIGSLLLAGGGLVAVNSSRWLAALILMLLGLVAMSLAYLLYRRGKSSGVVIRADGLQLFEPGRVLPWSAIDDFQFSQNQGTLIVQLILSPQVQPPKLLVSRLRASYVKRKHRVKLQFMGVSGKRAEEVCRNMAEYWQAFQARQELERMGVGV